MEYVAMALSALLAIPVWYWIGSRFDDSIRSGCIGLRSLIGIWLSFILLCLVGALALPGEMSIGRDAHLSSQKTVSWCALRPTQASNKTE
jgi:hypothetical protein